LLMDMVQRGEVALSDPLATYLPAHVTVPHRNGRQITLEDLATHRSGLPRLPSNLVPTDRSNPYADYTVDRLYDFLSTYELPREVGTKVEHSILGFGLLGHALERRAGIGYESLLHTRILDPLGMSSTGIALTPEVKARLAPGHNGELERVANWNLPAFASAGALWSTANDLLTFLGATLGQAKSPLSAAASALLRVSRELGREGPLGWWSVTLDGAFARDGRSVYLTSGATRGYSAFAGFEPKTQAGVVLLANVLSVSWGRISELYDFGNVGLHLLDPRWPLH
jgi:D-alanyl-D-alanine-carboxypeptidase/D-alanyl-D-alanine-endopeptidase